jgi:dihydroflavonol-4-reductase
VRVLVTGATGLVGNRIAVELVKRGDEVRAPVRDVERARKMLPPEVELMRGEFIEPGSLPPAVAGRELLFHVAGLPEQWMPDESDFDCVNRQETANLLAAAREAQVKRVVYTSTMDVFAAP